MSAIVRCCVLAGFILVFFAMSMMVGAQESPDSPVDYFGGAQLSPLMDDNAKVPSTEPAAAIIFSSSTAGIDAAQKFDAWQQQPRKHQYGLYGVVQLKSGPASEVVLEAIRQRELKMPLFRTSADLLQGADYSVMLMNAGRTESMSSIDLAKLEARLASMSGTAGEASVTTATASAAMRTGWYLNEKYGYEVEFPPDFSYVASRNGDGAIGSAPDGSSLQLRVWAVPNNTDTSGNTGTMTMPEYLRRHLSFVAEKAQTTLNLEKKYVVQDEGMEGRDYLYRFTSSTDGEPPTRGRIMVFETDGVFKVACAEAPDAEFGDRLGMIDRFFSSFRPRSKAKN